MTSIVLDTSFGIDSIGQLVAHNTESTKFGRTATWLKSHCLGWPARLIPETWQTRQSVKLVNTAAPEEKSSLSNEFYQDFQEGMRKLLKNEKSAAEKATKFLKDNAHLHTFIHTLWTRGLRVQAAKLLLKSQSLPLDTPKDLSLVQTVFDYVSTENPSAEFVASRSLVLELLVQSLDKKDDFYNYINAYKSNLLKKDLSTDLLSKILSPLFAVALKNQDNRLPAFLFTNLSDEQMKGIIDEQLKYGQHEEAATLYHAVMQFKFPKGEILSKDEILQAFRNEQLHETYEVERQRPALIKAQIAQYLESADENDRVAQLHKACILGDMNAFEKVMSSLNVKEKRELIAAPQAKTQYGEILGFTSLHFAILSGNQTFVEGLLDKFSCENYINGMHQPIPGYFCPYEPLSPLHLSIVMEKPDLSLSLLKKGANHQEESEGLSFERRKTIFSPNENFISQSLFKFPKHNQKESMLSFYAASLRHLVPCDSVEENNHGAALAKYLQNGDTASILRFFRDHPGESNPKLSSKLFSRSEYLFHEAIYSGNWEVAATCVEQAIRTGKLHELFKADEHGMTPFAYADLSGQQALVAFLMAQVTNGASADLQKLSSAPSSMSKEEHKNAKKVFQDLSDYRVNTGQLSELHKACYKGDLTQVKILLDKGDNPEDIAQFSKKLSPDLQKQNGFTALHYAVLSGRPSVVKFLLDSGVNVDPTSNNVSPLHLAATLNVDNTAYHQILSLLKGAEANFSRLDEQGFGMLHRLSAKGDEGLIYLNQHSNLFKLDEQNHDVSPLHLLHIANERTHGKGFDWANFGVQMSLAASPYLMASDIPYVGVCLPIMLSAATMMSNQHYRGHLNKFEMLVAIGRDNFLNNILWPAFSLVASAGLGDWGPTTVSALLLMYHSKWAMQSIYGAAEKAKDSLRVNQVQGKGLAKQAIDVIPELLSMGHNGRFLYTTADNVYRHFNPVQECPTIDPNDYDFWEDDLERISKIDWNHECKEHNFKILNLDPSSTENEIKKKYRFISKSTHPDKCKVNHPEDICSGAFNTASTAKDCLLKDFANS